MSIKHPIIAITGSSGAGTTSVKMTFEQIFRREKINPVYIEGDAFHRWNRAEMRERMKEAERAGTTTTATSDSTRTCSRSSKRPSVRIPRRAAERRPRLCPRRARGRIARGCAWLLHGVARVRSRAPTFCSTRACRAVVTDKVDSPVRRSQDRRRVGHQSRMDRKAASRQGFARIHDRARSPTRSSGACPTLRRIICPQFTETDINFQRVPTVTRRTRLSRAGFRHLTNGWSSSASAIRTASSFPYLLWIVSHQLHHSGQLDRDPRRQARHRDAAHPHANDSETCGAAATRSSRLNWEGKQKGEAL